MQAALMKIRNTEFFPTKRGERVLAVGLWALGLAFWAGAFAYLGPVREYLNAGPQLSNLEQALQVLLSFAAMLTLTTMGLFIVLRGASRRFGWLMLAAGFFLNLDAFAQFYSLYALLVHPEAVVPFGQLAAWVQNLWVISLGLVFIYLPLLFPTGKLPSARWRPVFWAITIFLALFVLVLAFADLPLTNIFLELDTPVRNPYGLISVDFIPESVGQGILVGTGILFAMSLLAALASLVFRWRGAGHETRQQIKWLLFALGVLVVLRLVDWIGGWLYGSTPAYPRLELYLRYGQQIARIGIALALGIAILRYRLYDIDIIIRRTLQYTLITAILALVYFGTVAVTQPLIRAVTGEQSELAIVISTLAIAALFNPLRTRVQGFIDRRFYRTRYDAQRTLATFAATARDEVELESLSRSLLTTVRKTMKPEQASLWLINREPEPGEAG